MLYTSTQFDDNIIDFYNSLDPTDLFLQDQYWLLSYQLFLDGKIQNPYANEAAYENLIRGNDTTENAKRREIQVFQTLKDNNVTFIDAETINN